MDPAKHQPPPIPPDVRPESNHLGRPAIRFSVGTLLILTAAVATGCVVATTFPRNLMQIVIGAAWLAAAGWLAMGALFGRGGSQAFCIGAAIVMSSMWTGLGGHFMDGVHRSAFLLGLEFGGDSAGMLWMDTLVLASAAVLNGWCCVYARRFFERG